MSGAAQGQGTDVPAPSCLAVPSGGQGPPRTPSVAVAMHIYEKQSAGQVSALHEPWRVQGSATLLVTHMV